MNRKIQSGAAQAIEHAAVIVSPEVLGPNFEPGNTHVAGSVDHLAKIERLE
jgi:hypothetical protein